MVGKVGRLSLYVFLLVRLCCNYVLCAIEKLLKIWDPSVWWTNSSPVGYHTQEGLSMSSESALVTLLYCYFSTRDFFSFAIRIRRYTFHICYRRADMVFVFMWDGYVIVVLSWIDFQWLDMGILHIRHSYNSYVLEFSVQFHLHCVIMNPWYLWMESSYELNLTCHDHCF